MLVVTCSRARAPAAAAPIGTHLGRPPGHAARAPAHRPVRVAAAAGPGGRGAVPGADAPRSARATAAWTWRRRRAAPCSPPRRAPWCSPAPRRPRRRLGAARRRAADHLRTGGPGRRRAGRRSDRGAVLGAVAAGHRACRAACLHWGVRRERLAATSTRSCCSVPPHVRLLPVPEPWPTREPAVSRRELLEPAAQPAHQPGVQLADPRLGDPEQPADLGERAVLQVVQAQDQPVALAELGDRGQAAAGSPAPARRPPGPGAASASRSSDAAAAPDAAARR